MAEPSKVIRIRNVGNDITEDELLELVKPFGVVAKLVMLRAKNRALLQMEDMEASAGAVEYYTQANVRFSTFQALVQYQESAIEAKGMLQERNVYEGCCKLDIQFSNLTDLQVNYNNGRSRDLTNPSLPTDKKRRSSQPSAGAQFAQMGNAAAIAAAFGDDLPPEITGTNDRCTIFAANLEPDKIDENKLFNLFSLYMAIS